MRRTKSLMFTPIYTIEEKKVIVDEWMESGLSMAEFCRRKEISTSTFEGWLNRFYPDREKKIQTKRTGLVKIQSTARERELVMEYCGASIRFGQSALKDVILALNAVNG